MVDAVVSFVVNRIADLLIQEAVFIGRVRQEVQWLKDELERMQCYVANAEENHVDDPMVRKWLTDITKIAYDIEDVLDNYILQVRDDEDTEEGAMERKPGCFPSISSCMKCREKVNLRENVKLHNMGKDIEELKIRINDLPRIQELYKLESCSKKGEGKSNSHVRLTQLRRTTSFSIEEKVVGHEDGIETLLAKLLVPDPRRCTVSICGMGGLGKTTLAGRLYHHLEVKRKFKYCGWVCVSQDYSTHDLLARIAKSFRFEKKIEKLQLMCEEDLGRYLYESLEEHSYLLVIDDIWKIEAWESIKRAFPDSNNGSRLIITTRNKEVAEHSNERTYVHNLRFLTFEESWQLFCEKAFGNPNANNVEEELKTLGMKMVQKCRGLPLAVIVLGGLLSTKTNPRDWKVVSEQIWRDLKKASTGSIHIRNLFALSFNDLSYQLKPCFLYLSLFPEDSEIDVDTLIKLWVAEGFISQEEDRKMEDVAKDNFHDLINRSLIQIGKISWGRVATCRVHDALRDLAIEKARELKFSYIYDQMKHSKGDFSIISSYRREAIYLIEENHLWLQQSNPSLRSLLFFGPYNYGERIGMLLPRICTNFKFLRVLSLSWRIEIRDNSLIKFIGKLIHLKYLGLKCLFRNYLPRQICNLQRLQTLDLSGPVVRNVVLPNDISMLGELRHLYGRFGGHLPIDTLTKLQSLRHVETETWIRINTEKLVNLRELWIFGSLPTGTKRFPFDSIANLERLEQLVVGLSPCCCFASLQPLTRCSNLMDLRLYGYLEKLPEDMDQILPNLECLLIRHSGLTHDPMPSLAKLPSLMILYLGFCFYAGLELYCSAQGFRRLEILKVEWWGNPIIWQVEDGAMPKLRSLSMPEVDLPERWRSIPPPIECEFDGAMYDLEHGYF